MLCGKGPKGPSVPPHVRASFLEKVPRLSLERWRSGQHSRGRTGR